MATAEERLMAWLRDAHAAEEQAETMLSGFAGRLENYPDLKKRVEAHVTETRRQSEKVRGCDERRKGSTSTLKVAGAKAMAQWLGDHIETITGKYLRLEEKARAAAKH